MDGKRGLSGMKDKGGAAPVQRGVAPGRTDVKPVRTAVAIPVPTVKDPLKPLLDRAPVPTEMLGASAPPETQLASRPGPGAATAGVPTEMVGASAPSEEHAALQAGPSAAPIVRLEALVGQDFRFADFVAALYELDEESCADALGARKSALAKALAAVLSRSAGQAVAPVEVRQILEDCLKQLASAKPSANKRLGQARDAYVSAIRRALRKHDQSAASGTGPRDRKDEARAAPARQGRAPGAKDKYAYLRGMDSAERISLLVATLRTAKAEGSVEALQEQIRTIKWIKKNFSSEARQILNQAYTAGEVASMAAQIS